MAPRIDISRIQSFEELLRLFQSLDKDGDGRLASDECDTIDYFDQDHSSSVEMWELIKRVDWDRMHSGKALFSHVPIEHFRRFHYLDPAGQANATNLGKFHLQSMLGLADTGLVPTEIDPLLKALQGVASGHDLEEAYAAIPIAAAFLKKGGLNSTRIADLLTQLIQKSKRDALNLLKGPDVTEYAIGRLIHDIRHETNMTMEEFDRFAPVILPHLNRGIFSQEKTAQLYHALIDSDPSALVEADEAAPEWVQLGLTPDQIFSLLMKGVEYGPMAGLALATLRSFLDAGLSFDRAGTLLAEIAARRTEFGASPVDFLTLTLRWAGLSKDESIQHREIDPGSIVLLKDLGFKPDDLRGLFALPPEPISGGLPRNLIPAIRTLQGYGFNPDTLQGGFEPAETVQFLQNLARLTKGRFDSALESLEKAVTALKLPSGDKGQLQNSLLELARNSQEETGSVYTELPVAIHSLTETGIPGKQAVATLIVWSKTCGRGTGRLFKGIPPVVSYFKSLGYDFAFIDDYVVRLLTRYGANAAAFLPGGLPPPPHKSDGSKEWTDPIP